MDHVNNKLAKCTNCNVELMVNGDSEMSVCVNCNTRFSTAEGIKKRNVEVALRPAEIMTKPKKTQRAIATLICFFILAACFFFLEPEVFKQVDGKVASYLISGVVGVMLCNIVFKFVK